MKAFSRFKQEGRRALHLSCLHSVTPTSRLFLDEFYVGGKVLENEDKIFGRRDIPKQTNAGTWK